MDFHIRLRTAHRRLARLAYSSCPHPGDEWRKLPARYKQEDTAAIKIYQFDRIEEAMTDLEAGRITAVMKVAPVAAWLAAKSPDLRIVAQVPDDPQPLGSGFGKNEPALVAAVNGALQS